MPKIIYIKDMSKSQAKEEIKSFFNHVEGDTYPSEISEILGIDYDPVWEIIKELDEEGIIETGD